MTKGNTVSRIARAALAACAVLLGALAAGCDGNESGFGNYESDMSPQEQFNTLMQRPDIDAAVKRYRSMSEEIRTQLSRQFDLPDWNSGGGGRVSPGCNDFPDVHGWDAEQHVGDDWDTPKPLTNAQWPDAVSEVKEIARSYGFDKVTFEVAKEQFREIKLADRYGATLYFGKETNTLIGVDTGCHLNAEAKDRGAPRSTTTS